MQGRRSQSRFYYPIIFTESQLLPTFRTQWRHGRMSGAFTALLSGGNKGQGYGNAKTISIGERVQQYDTMLWDTML
jgi:hypothetical protein